MYGDIVVRGFINQLIGVSWEVLKVEGKSKNVRKIFIFSVYMFVIFVFDKSGYVKSIVFIILKIKGKKVNII